MFVGRAKELRLLEEYYNRKESLPVVVYGRLGIGKTELLRLFAKNKICFYYYVADCSDKEQKKRLQKSLGSRKETYEELFYEAQQTYSLVILDEFHNGAKQEKEFLAGLLKACQMENDREKGLVILSSSLTDWVENDMASGINKTASSFSAFLKLEELGFMDIMTRFPDYSVKECVEVYGILGGVPAYLGDWNEKRSVKENIINLFLHKNGRLYHEGESFLKTQLRELSAYSTILSYLAQGKTQLTELYELTGFSRAKVSVYLKNLMALDVVEKVTSYEIKAKENTKKGVYRLRDTCLLFWYRFVYPNLSKLEERKMEEVYDKEILPALEDYLELSFSKVCREYMRLLSDYKKLPFRIKALDSWQGKTGELKLIGQGDDGALFVGGCKWSEEPLKEEDFIEILHLSEQAKVKPDYYYLFSKSGFASSLEVKTKGMENVILMDLEDM